MCSVNNQLILSEEVDNKFGGAMVARIKTRSF
jgi:hypothetical protein